MVFPFYYQSTVIRANGYSDVLQDPLGLIFFYLGTEGPRLTNVKKIFPHNSVFLQSTGEKVINCKMKILSISLVCSVDRLTLPPVPIQY